MEIIENIKQIDFQFSIASWANLASGWHLASSSLVTA